MSPTSAAQATVAWTECGGGFQCSNLQVPLDYTNPDGRKIQLALIRKPATDPSHRIGSLLMNPGGPGGSGIEFLRAFAPILTDLNTRFDLMAWDPRGVGASTAVTCLDGPQLDAYFALDSVVDDPAEQDAWVKANQAFAIGCQRRSGDLLPFMDTESTARDLDRIRAAVGDAKLTYLGFSYGTLIGQWYAHLFPSHIRALALDGVADPDENGSSEYLTSLTAFEQNLQAFLDDCKSRTTCAYGRSGDPRTKLVAAMNRLDAAPLAVGNRQLTRSIAMNAVFATMYDQLRWNQLADALSALDAGDGSKLLAISDHWNERNPDGTYSNFMNGAFAATACTESFASTNLIEPRGPQESDIIQASPFFGAWLEWRGLYCDYWPVTPKATRPPTVQGAPPILLVGATGDPATPYASAENVHKEIPNSVLLTRIGNGHTSYEFSTCITAAENAYLLNLTLPAAGTVCSS